MSLLNNSNKAQGNKKNKPVVGGKPGLPAAKPSFPKPAGTAKNTRITGRAQRGS